MNAVKASVSRTKPDGYRVDLELSELNPPQLLLQYFKEGRIDWSEYYKRYLDFIYSNNEALKVIKNISDRLENGESFVFYCWEKDMPCHRFILGQLFLEMGHDVKLFYGPMIYQYEDGSCYYTKGTLDPDYVCREGNKIGN